MNFMQIKAMEEMLVKQMWHSGYKFVSCWNLNKGKQLNEFLSLESITVSTGEKIKSSEVIKMVIESEDIKGYAIVVLSPNSVIEHTGEDKDLVYSFNYKAKELFRLFNLAPTVSRMTMPKPFSNYRKEVVKMVESLEDVIRMVRIGNVR